MSSTDSPRVEVATIISSQRTTDETIDGSMTAEKGLDVYKCYMKMWKTPKPFDGEMGEKNVDDNK